MVVEWCVVLFGLLYVLLVVNDLLCGVVELVLLLLDLKLLVCMVVGDF